jgi:hypothetical protein
VHFADQVSLQNYTCDDIVSHSISEDSDKFMAYLLSASTSGNDDALESWKRDWHGGIPDFSSEHRDVKHLPPEASDVRGR